MDKERFLEGNRQKWCAIILTLDLGVLLLHSLGRCSDPATFVSAFSGVGALFILGASADSVMKIYQVGSQTQTVSQTVNSHQIVEQKVVADFQQKYSGDPSVNVNYNPDSRS